MRSPKEDSLIEVGVAQQGEPFTACHSTPTKSPVSSSQVRRQVDCRRIFAKKKAEPRKSLDEFAKEVTEESPRGELKRTPKHKKEEEVEVSLRREKEKSPKQRRRRKEGSKSSRRSSSERRRKKEKKAKAQGKEGQEEEAEVEQLHKLGDLLESQGGEA